MDELVSRIRTACESGYKNLVVDNDVVRLYKDDKFGARTFDDPDTMCDVVYEWKEGVTYPEDD